MTELVERPQCVLGSPEKPHNASVGLLVCDNHREELYERLRAIVDTLARISIRPAASGASTGVRSGGLKSQRFVLDVESVALAGPLAPGEITTPDGWDEHHPLAVVGAWARLVREERGLTPPDGPAALTTEVDLLVRHLDWCCAQPWIDDMADEINVSLKRVQRADPHRHRPGDEGRCPAVGNGPNNTCGGQLRRERGSVPWILRDDRCERAFVDVPAGPIRCQRCGANWLTARDEANLRVMSADMAREMMRPRTADGHPMQTARELADQCGKRLPAMRKTLQRLNAEVVGGQWYDPRVVSGQFVGDMVS